MNELSQCSGIENYRAFFSAKRGIPASRRPCSTISPADGLLVIDEPTSRCRRSAVCTGATGRAKRRWWNTVLPPSRRRWITGRCEVWQRIQRRAPQTIYACRRPGAYELINPAARLDQVVRPTGLLDLIIEVRPVATQVDDLAVRDPPVHGHQRARAGHHYQADGGGLN